MECLFILSGEHPALARAECKAANKGSAWQELPQALLGRVEGSRSERLAFTKTAYQVIEAGTPMSVKRRLAENPHPVEESVKVERVELEPGTAPGTEEVRTMLIPWLGRPAVDLAHPEKTVALITTGERWYVAERLWTNTERFEERKNQRRPAPHPTSLHPKLARAMVNLSRARKDVLDPFCGSGGILLEAGLMGLRCTGTDIDPAMVERARKNLEHYSIEAELRVQDALHNDDSVEAIVTDLPYGRNSKAEELAPLYTAFLERAKLQTERIVIGFPDLVDAKTIAVTSGWSVRQSFSWRLHKSLTKRILFLEKEFSVRDPRARNGRAKPDR